MSRRHAYPTQTVSHPCFRGLIAPVLGIGCTVVVLFATTWAMAQTGPEPAPLTPPSATIPKAGDAVPAKPPSVVPNALPNPADTDSLPPPTAAIAPTQAPENPDAGIPPNTFGHLGITVAPADSDDGLTVIGIEPTSPAYPAGLIINDQITAINGQRITKFSDLVKGLRAAAETDGNVGLLVRRRGTLDTINVMVGGKTAQVDRPRLGISLDDSNGRLRVVGVTPKSPADVAGVQVGDEILTVNDYPVSTFDLFVGQIQAMGRAGGQVPLGIRRNGKTLTLRATIGGAQQPALPKSDLPPSDPAGIK